MIVNVQVFRLAPAARARAREDRVAAARHAQRDRCSLANDADPELPTDTLTPAGLDVIRSPLRPVAVTVKVAFWPAGVTVNVAVRVTLPAVAVIVTGVDAVTVVVAIAKVALVAL